MSAQTNTTQTKLNDETPAEYTRRRAKSEIGGVAGDSQTTRFLVAVPADTELDELDELWDVYMDAVEADE